MVKQSSRGLILAITIVVLVTIGVLAALFCKGTDSSAPTTASSMSSDSGSETQGFAAFEAGDEPTSEDDANPDAARRAREMRSAKSGELPAEASAPVKSAVKRMNNAQQKQRSDSPSAAGATARPTTRQDRDSATQDPSSAPPAIPSQDIQRVMADQYKPAVKECYAKISEQFPDVGVSGRVVVAFDIIAEDGQGRVELAEPGENSTLFDDELRDCMLGGLGDVMFPVPEGAQKLRVNYPFNFATDEPDTAAAN